MIKITGEEISKVVDLLIVFSSKVKSVNFHLSYPIDSFLIALTCNEREITKTYLTFHSQIKEMLMLITKEGFYSEEDLETLKEMNT